MRVYEGRCPVCRMQEILEATSSEVARVTLYHFHREHYSFCPVPRQWLVIREAARRNRLIPRLTSLASSTV